MPTKNKTITMKPMVSSCCKGGFVVATDYQKNKKHYECLLCEKSCDIEPFKKPTKNKQENWEKEFDKLKKRSEFISGKVWHISSKIIKPFIAKELTKKDKEFIEILNGLEMKARNGMEDNIQYKLGYNLAAYLFNDKIKQIKKKYE